MSLYVLCWLGCCLWRALMVDEVCIVVKQRWTWNIRSCNYFLILARYSSGRYASQCMDDEWMYVCIGIGCGLFVGIIIVIILKCCGYCKKCCQCKQCCFNNKLFPSSFGKNASSDVDEFIFQSGFWTTLYYQCKSWHGPHRLSLVYINQRRPNSIQINHSLPARRTVWLVKTRKILSNYNLDLHRDVTK